jgi:hypothetical protein
MNLPRSAPAILGLALLAQPLRAQTLEPVVRRTVVVSSDLPGTSLVETWLAVDPTAADHLLAVAMFPDADSSAVYRTRDGGATWMRTAPAGRRTFPGGDPVVAFAPDGRAFVTTITPRFTVWGSAPGDGGWDEPVELEGGSYDRQWIASDATGGDFRGRVYSAGKIWIRVLDSPAQDLMALSRSRDGGRTFEPPELILPNPARQFLHVVNDLRVDGAGRIRVLYSAFAMGAGERGMPRGAFFLLTSDDGGDAYGEPLRVADYVMFSNAWGDTAMKGLGGGRLAVDPTDPNRLYVVWVHPLDEHLQVLLTSTADGGASWSEPMRVNDGGFGSHHSNPGLAVGEDGVVAVTWNDRRNDPDDRCFQLFMALSADGGRTFGPNRQVGEGRTCPRAGRWVNGGDTQGLVALPDGSYHLAWIDGSRGALRMMSSVVDVRRDR